VDHVDFSLVRPEIALSLYAMAALMLAVYTSKDGMARLITWLTVAVMVALAVWIGLCSLPEGTAFGGAMHVDAFARFAKVTILLSAAAVLAMSDDWMVRQGMARFEYPILIALAVVGMMVMVSAGDLMTLYMGLELQSLALYVVAAFRRDSVRSNEAGLKYFVLGALSSGLLLYGASLVYGFTGTTLFTGIAAAATGGHLTLGALFGLVFVIAGLAFKVSAVPFHMWTPDVYEGSPTPVTAFFATAPKVAAMGLFARVLFDAFGGAVADWSQIIALLAVLSMFVGAIAAIRQTDIKRLMAYSSIAHMGFALVGLAAGTAAGVQATLTYMAIYAAMNVATFAFILAMERGGKPATDIDDLSLIARVEPTRALALLVLLFSLAGVPPMLGFFAKFAVLRAAVDANMAWLAILGVIASVIGAYYYLRIVYVMYFGAEREQAQLRGGPVAWLMLVGGAAVMILGVVNLFGIEGAATAAAQALVP